MARGVVLGFFEGTDTPTAIHDSVRHRDVYVIGAKQTGKSTVLLNMALQEIKAGKGLAVIDPHGDLTRDLLKLIPKERVADTIYLDPKRCPIPIPFLEAKDEDEANYLASDVILAFEALTPGWGAQMDEILKFCVRTLLEPRGQADPAPTLLDIYRLLCISGYRSQLVHKVRNREIQEFWKFSFPSYERQGKNQPILRRMTDFRLSSTLQAIFGSSGGLDIQDIMDSQKILIVNLAPATDIDKYYIGSLLVSKIKNIAFRRENLPKLARVPFYLYVDEFQTFKTTAFRIILNETGKFKLHLVIANQLLGDLNSDIQRAIRGNVGSFVFLPLYSDEARYFADKLTPYLPEDAMQLIPKREAIYYSCLSRRAYKIRTILPRGRAEGYEEEILRNSRQLAAASRHAAEEHLEFDEDIATGKPDDSVPPNRPKKKDF